MESYFFLIQLHKENKVGSFIEDERREVEASFILTIIIN